MQNGVVVDGALDFDSVFVVVRDGASVHAGGRQVRVGRWRRGGLRAHPAVPHLLPRERSLWMGLRRNTHHPRPFKAGFCTAATDPRGGSPVAAADIREQRALSERRAVRGPISSRRRKSRRVRSQQPILLLLRERLVRRNSRALFLRHVHQLPTSEGQEQRQVRSAMRRPIPLGGRIHLGMRRPIGQSLLLNPRVLRPRAGPL